jgi:lantibiotic modifying enzyme
LILDQIILSIEGKINNSYESFIRDAEEPITLISGISGCALFYAYSFKKFHKSRFLEKTCELVDICIDKIAEIEQPSLYQGFTGIAWLIRHLVNQKIYDKSSLNILESIDEHIEKTIDTFISYKYYSLMYGLIGHGIYFTEALQNGQNEVVYRKSLEKLFKPLMIHP